MPYALRLLIWLQFRAFCRQIRRALTTPRGIIIAMVVAGFFCLMLFPLILTLFRGDGFKEGFASIGKERFGHYVPFLLFAYVVSALVTSLGSESLYFSEEEVEMLFPAPFSRRQLLVYKLWGVLKLSLFSSAFTAMGMAAFMGNFLISAIGFLQIFLFTSLFPLLLTLVGQIGIAHAFNRRRKLIGLVCLALFGFAFAQGFGNIPEIELTEIDKMAKQILNSTVGSILFAPFNVFANLLFSNGFDASYFGNLGIAIGINLTLLAGILLLDANYLGVVEKTSKKIADLQKKTRSTGGMVIGAKSEYTASLPMLPRMAGMGPLIWRQMLVTFRLSKGLLFITLILMGVMLVPMLFESKDSISDNPAFPALVLVGVSYMTLFFAMGAPVGFRPDIQRMEVFKTLPMSNTPIALGQLIGSVLMLSMIQICLISLFACFSWRWISIWLAGFACILPFNYLSLAVANTLILLFPVKIAAGPKDFTAMGQGLISLFAMGGTMMILALCVAGLGALAFLITQNWAVTIGVGILVTCCFCIVASVALVKAYGRFDVSLHSP